ncbi:rCG27394 [Rattus norvegicus]|uniref:RCG27394 n=1 Tax=Rattus norvegicus TaxID=10116 RepID=A6HP96_RAT|nr:rCG27394 [Rattus norvegicus]
MYLNREREKKKYKHLFEGEILGVSSKSKTRYELQ